MPKSPQRKQNGKASQGSPIPPDPRLENGDQIDREMKIRLHYYAEQDDPEISRRIAELDEERDLESFLEANAASVSLLGLVLGVAFSRKWLLLPVVTGAFLFHHAVKGWTPPAVKRMGVRTRQEIDREKYLLKAMRGDFDGLKSSRHGGRPKTS